VDSLSDLPLRREALNCSSLHPSGRFSSPSRRLSVFDQASDFLSKRKYGKIATTVRMTWIPVRTPVYHGLDVRSTDMEIACSRSPVRTAILLVRTCKAFIRKLLAADVRLSRRGSQTGKIFSENLKILVAHLSIRTAYDHSPDGAQLYQARRSFESLAYK
jgi:hypothetical protein